MLLRVTIKHTDNFIAVEPLVAMPFYTLKKQAVAAFAACGRLAEATG